MFQRVYDKLFRRHLAEHRQMIFVTGPRQVGKTTTCSALAAASGVYLSWDRPSDRRLILKGADAVAEHAGVQHLQRGPVVIVLDELHKYAHWRDLLKGLFDSYEKQLRVVVTGSSKLDIRRRSGDSLMGRYFAYRMHPLSVGELLQPQIPEREIMPPRKPGDAAWRRLWEHGGFPEPFAKHSNTFTRRWRDLRLRQLVRADVRDIAHIQRVAEVEVLAHILAERSATQLNFHDLTNDISGRSDHTTKSWVNTLVSFYHGFLTRPWHRNVSSAVRKQPKWYLRDWSGIRDPGARAETFVACHLLKAVELWEDLGLGDYGLYYLRDKRGREVDFLVTRDAEPWFLVEVKAHDERLSPALADFQQQTGARHAFQVVLDRDYVDVDCFSRRDPVIVPARTFLSQLP